MQDIFNNLNQELANLSIYKPVTNPYVENLIEMGYDRADCETVAAAGVDKTFPSTFTGECINPKQNTMKHCMTFSMDNKNIVDVTNSRKIGRIFGTHSTTTTMKTTAQMYLVRIYDQFTMMQVTKTMPTTPKTSKGIKSQQNRVLNWARKTYPNNIRYEVEPVPIR